MKTEKSTEGVWVVLKADTRTEGATYFVRKEDRERIAEKIQQIKESKKYFSKSATLKRKE